eukprot:TRINITY_DN2421_c0_g1_i1.p1 TRINITY_DN2421_c0_g1~~TRINITY_DN2421_c0_g1_i1.p1  ORF type:complete len:584 (+),score=118.68 TRINITY_DN2421_c0_g1_i1:148-1752(+)
MSLSQLQPHGQSQQVHPQNHSLHSNQHQQAQLQAQTQGHHNGGFAPQTQVSSHGHPQNHPSGYAPSHPSPQTPFNTLSHSTQPANPATPGVYQSQAHQVQMPHSQMQLQLQLQSTQQGQSHSSTAQPYSILSPSQQPIHSQSSTPNHHSSIMSSPYMSSNSLASSSLHNATVLSNAPNQTHGPGPSPNAPPSTPGIYASNQGSSSLPSPAPSPTASAGNMRVKKRMFYGEISAIMYAFGDTKHTLADTCEFVESIVRQQIIEFIRQIISFCQKRNHRPSIEDVFFLLKQEPMRFYRIRDAWSLKESQKLTTPSIQTRSIPQVDSRDDLGEHDNGFVRGRKRLRLSWDLVNFLYEGDDDDEEDFRRKDSTDISNMNIAREVMIRSMTSEQYQDYSESRQASFHVKKSKKFRDWCDPYMSELKPTEDIVELLAHLAWDIVGLLALVAGITKRMAERKSFQDLLLIAVSFGMYEEVVKTTRAARIPMKDLFAREHRLENMLPGCGPILPNHVRDAMRLMYPMRTSATDPYCLIRSPF